MVLSAPLFPPLDLAPSTIGIRGGAPLPGNVVSLQTKQPALAVPDPPPVNSSSMASAGRMHPSSPLAVPPAFGDGGPVAGPSLRRRCLRRRIARRRASRNQRRLRGCSLAGGAPADPESPCSRARSPPPTPLFQQARPRQRQAGPQPTYPLVPSTISASATIVVQYDQRLLLTE